MRQLLVTWRNHRTIPTNSSLCEAHKLFNIVFSIIIADNALCFYFSFFTARLTLFDQILILSETDTITGAAEFFFFVLFVFISWSVSSVRTHNCFMLILNSTFDSLTTFYRVSEYAPRFLLHFRSSMYSNELPIACQLFPPKKQPLSAFFPQLFCSRKHVKSVFHSARLGNLFASTQQQHTRSGLMQLSTLGVIVRAEGTSRLIGFY